MNSRYLIEKIDHLFWIGAVQGAAPLKLYHLFSGYRQGIIAIDAVQWAIEELDPDPEFAPCFEEPDCPTGEL